MANQEISVLVDDVVLESKSWFSHISPDLEKYINFITRKDFPEGSKVVRAVRHGYSDWSALTARLVVEEPGGRMTEFFLKVWTGDSESVLGRAYFHV